MHRLDCKGLVNSREVQKSHYNNELQSTRLSMMRIHQKWLKCRWMDCRGLEYKGTRTRGQSERSQDTDTMVNFRTEIYQVREWTAKGDIMQVDQTKQNGLKLNTVWDARIREHNQESDSALAINLSRIGSFICNICAGVSCVQLYNTGSLCSYIIRRFCL